MNMALLKRPPAEAPVTTPVPTTLRAASPDYAELDDRESALKQRQRDLEAEQSRLMAELHDHPTDGGKSARVASLLGDPDAESWQDPRERLKAIGQEMADARAALAIVGERKRPARLAASKKICDEIQPEYVRVVGELAQALIAAHTAHQAVTRITSRLTSADIAWVSHLAPMQCRDILGEPHDPQSKLARYLGAAADLGAIKPAEIPEFRYAP